MINAINDILVTLEASEKAHGQIVLPVSYYFASAWWQEDSDIDSEHRVQIHLISPQGEDLGGPEFDVSFQGGGVSRSNIQVNGLPYTEDGIYRCIVSQLDGDEPSVVHSIPIRIACKSSEEIKSDST